MDVDAGPLPDVSGLTQLTSIDLGSNHLTGNVSPLALAHLSNLRALDLSSNSFTGTVMHDVVASAGMEYLETLALQSNLFSESLPSAFGGLKRLTSLNFATNSFFGTVPTQLGNLTPLRVFVFNENSFYGTLPTTLGSLTRVYSLFPRYS